MPFLAGIILHFIIQHRDTESAEAAEDVRGSDHSRLLKFALMNAFFFVGFLLVRLRIIQDKLHSYSCLQKRC